MKVKLNWPTGIILALLAFIIFILSFVYKATFVPEYDHHLVSDEYYNDELKYQEEIDKLKRAADLDENVSIKKVEAGLLITFPSEFDIKQIKGSISFKRMSNHMIDFSFPIALNSHQFLLIDEKLVDGRWDVKIEWKADSISYLFKEKIIY